LNTYKHHGSTFILIIKHVSLKELESWLIRGQIVPSLREKRPFKKSTPKSNAASGIIAGELLIIETNSWKIRGVSWESNPALVKASGRGAKF
jgi:hypothetical protein